MRRHPIKHVCRNGHSMSGENLLLKPRSRTVQGGKTYQWVERCCVECYRQWRREYREKQSMKTSSAVILDGVEARIERDRRWNSR